MHKLKTAFQNLVADKNAIHFHVDLPVFVLPEKLDEDYFSKRGIIISSFAYPDPTGKKINRAVLNALHTNADLQHFVDAI